MWHKYIFFKATSVIVLKVACVSKFLTFDYLEYFKRKKITFENIDTNPELGRSLLLAVSSDWMPGLHASQHALYFHTFCFPFHPCQLPPLLPPTQGNYGSCCLSYFCVSILKVEKRVFPASGLLVLQLNTYQNRKQQKLQRKWLWWYLETPHKEISPIGNIKMQKKLFLFRGIFNFFTNMMTFGNIRMLHKQVLAT